MDRHSLRAIRISSIVVSTSLKQMVAVIQCYNMHSMLKSLTLYPNTNTNTSTRSAPRFRHSAYRFDEGQWKSQDRTPKPDHRTSVDFMLQQRTVILGFRAPACAGRSYREMDPIVIVLTSYTICLLTEEVREISNECHVSPFLLPL